MSGHTGRNRPDAVAHPSVRGADRSLRLVWLRLVWLRLVRAVLRRPAAAVAVVCTLLVHMRTTTTRKIAFSHQTPAHTRAQSGLGYYPRYQVYNNRPQPFIGCYRDRFIAFLLTTLATYYMLQSAKVRFVYEVNSF